MALLFTLWKWARIVAVWRRKISASVAQKAKPPLRWLCRGWACPRPSHVQTHVRLGHAGNNAAASSTTARPIPKVIDVAARRQELETPRSIVAYATVARLAGNNAGASSTTARPIPKIIDVAARRQVLETPGA